MPKVDKMELSIRTGARGHSGPVRIEFNGHQTTLKSTAEGTQPGETFTGTFEPRSFAHQILLLGPDEGEWDAEEIAVSYKCAPDEPYVARMGPVVLNPLNAVDIWRESPLEAFEV